MGGASLDLARGRLRGGGHDRRLPTSSRVLRCTRSHQRDTTTLSLLARGLMTRSTRLTDDASARTRPASVQQQHRALTRTARLVHCCLACRSQQRGALARTARLVHCFHCFLACRSQQHGALARTARLVHCCLVCRSQQHGALARRSGGQACIRQVLPGRVFPVSRSVPSPPSSRGLLLHPCRSLPR